MVKRIIISVIVALTLFFLYMWWNKVGYLKYRNLNNIMATRYIQDLFENYYKKHGEYPDSAGVLKDSFVNAPYDNVFEDPFDRKPLKYVPI